MIAPQVPDHNVTITIGGILHVELALFDGDTLLERGDLKISEVEQVDSFRLFSARHSLGPTDASIFLFSFAKQINLKQTSLAMPIQESDDWETIDLAGYTLAFRCHLKV